MKEQCPHCHNVVVGQFKPSTSRNILTTVAKKGGTKAILGGVGGPVGFALGVAVDLVAKDHINKFVDNIADEFDDNKVFVFECPNCGHTWTRKEDDLDYDSSETAYGVEETGTDEDEMASQFNQSLSYLLNQTEEVIKSGSDVRAFIKEMNRYAANSETEICAAFHFLAAFAGLLFLKDGEADDNDEDEDIADRAISQIGKAISLRELDEYRLIERLLIIQTADNVDDLLKHIRVATCKVNETIWLKEEYYRKSLVPDICFFKIQNFCKDESVSDSDQATLWKTLVNSPVKDYRMYANLHVYFNLPENDQSEDQFLINAYRTKGFSLNKPEMESSMYLQWLWAAEQYAGLLCSEESELIGKDKAKGMQMLCTIADMGNAGACLFARHFLGEIAEEDGDLQKALAYYIKAGEMGAEDALRIRKMIAGNLQPSPSTTTQSALNKSQLSSVESEYIDEVKACLEDGGEISKGERRLLEKIRIKLGISEERAAELEQSVTAPQLTEDEQEYLAEYRECLSGDGEISAGERRLLNRLRDKLGISEKRASELEQIG